MSRDHPSAVRLLHLADVHLGAAFPWLGEKGAAHRRRVRQTFSDVLLQAASTGVNLVLVAGDLFASSHPHPDLTEFAAAQFARLTASGIEIVIAAGESDALDTQGLYAGGALDGIAGVTILPAASRVVELSELGVAVSGRSAVRGKEGADPLKGLVAGRQTWTIGLVALDPNRVGGRGALARAIAGTRFTYLALGGGHKMMDVGTETVPAWYPGSLELTVRTEGPGAALLVEVGGERPTVTPLPIARGRAQRLVVEPALVPSGDALAAEIEALADPDLSLEVRLTGRARPAQFFDVAALERRFAPRFFSLEITDEAMPDPALLAEPPGRSITVTGKFVELMTVQLQQASSEAERRRVGAAYRLGLWLLGERRDPA